MKKVLNVFGIIFGVIFSAALIVSLTVTPVLSGATNFFNTKNLQKMVNSIDFADILTESMGTASSAAEAQMLDTFMEAGVIEEFVTLYVEDLFAELDGDPTAKKLTPERVVQIFDKHMDVMVQMAKSQMDAETLQYVSDAEIEVMLRQGLEQEAPSMIASFPSLQELGIDEEVLDVVRTLRDGFLLKVGIALVVIFTLIVLACQFPRFKSFMWLGVDFVLGGGFAFVAAVGFELILKTAMVSMPFGMDVLNPMIAGFTGSIKKGAFVELGLAVLFIVIFVVGHKLSKPKATPEIG